jgi:Ca2+-binding RTX toxin-like protein
VTIDLSNQTTQQTVVPGLLNITLQSASYNVIGGSGDDTITGNSNNNTLTGNAGNDTLIGGAGNDTLYGNDGNDYLDGGESGSLEDLLYGGNGDDTLTGEGYNEYLTGGADSDTYLLNSTVSHDTSFYITEDANADSDTLDFSALTGNITFNLGSTGTQSATSNNAHTEYVFLSNSTAIENILGSSGNDTLTGNSRDNYLFGGAGNDTLSGGDGNDWLEGGAGNDSLTGGSGDDTYVFNPVNGASGDLGSDTVTEAANTGSDTLDFTSFSSDQPVAIALNSTASQSVSSGVLSLTLSSDTGIENVNGGAGDDAITGNNRDNTLDGGAGNDTLYGGVGDDRLYGDSGDDALYGDSGSDALYGGDGTDELHGGDDADFLYGQDGNDTLYGDAGNDILSGGAGDDSLTGGDGDDTYTFNWNPGDYGLGSDTIYESSGSGTGNDTLDFSNLQGVTDYNNSLVLSSTSIQAVSDDQVPDPFVLGDTQNVRDLLDIALHTGSTVENVTNPTTYSSAIDGLDVSPAANGDLTFTAVADMVSIDQVDFYWDTNGNGVYD